MKNSISLLKAGKKLENFLICFTSPCMFRNSMVRLYSVGGPFRAAALSNIK